MSGFKPLMPLIAGALAYTADAILEFLHLPVLLPRIIGSHEVFHMLVLAGVGLHWCYIRGLAGGAVAIHASLLEARLGAR
ncbi:MAG: hypothetical protein R3E86_06570 [Pseudomonadales bacterium]